jgi:hypothetical protein
MVIVKERIKFLQERRIQMEVNEEYGFLDDLFVPKKDKPARKSDFITEEFIQYVEEKMKEEQ